MSEFFHNGFVILLGGRTADLTLAIYFDVHLCGLKVRAVSWLLVFSGHCILAKWLLLSSAHTWNERWLIDISQLSASQFKEMADKAAHSRNQSLLLVAFCWWGGSALILSLEASRRRGKGFLPGMWDGLRHKHKMKMQSH